MMVVVLGDEEEMVHDRHGLAQPRMKGRSREILNRKRLHPRHGLEAPRAKCRQERPDRSLIVKRLMGRAVLEIGGPQLLQAAKKVVQASGPEWLQISQMAHVLLDG